MNETFNFSSIEDAKNFIKSTEGSSSLGVICIVDENGEMTHINFNDFVKSVGIDKAAQFLFETQEKCEQMAFSKDEITEIKEKVASGLELTEEERKKIAIFESYMKEKNSDVAALNTFYNSVTLVLINVHGAMLSTVGGAIAGFCGYMNALLFTSTELIKFTSKDTGADIVNEAIAGITMEDAAPEIQVLGLVNVLIDLIKKNQDAFCKVIDFESVINVLDLDESLFEKDLLDESNKISLDNIDDIMDSIMEDSNSEEEPKKETKEPIDIRSRLKNRK